MNSPPGGIVDMGEKSRKLEKKKRKRKEKKHVFIYGMLSSHEQPSIGHFQQ